MENLTAFVLYLTFYRLAIIAAGVTCVILGYLLFARGVFPKTRNGNSGQREEFSAKIASAKFRLRNAAPGTCFASFGMIIIVIMLISGSPEITLQMLNEGEIKASLRSGEIDKVETYSEKALGFLDQGDRSKASIAAKEALNLLAAPLNDLAWVLLKTEAEYSQSLLISELAVSIDPNNPNFLHTLAENQFVSGKKRKAFETLEKAQKIKPIFSEQLAKWRQNIP